MDPTAQEVASLQAHPLTERVVPLLLLLLGLIAFLYESWAVRPQIDDAYISYRYAQNLIEGHGLVFNIGEYVEGYTNLLWTLLVASGLALGFDANLVGHALGLVSGVSTLIATFLYARAGIPPSRAWIAVLAAGVVLSSTPFVYWSTLGMETPMFTAAVVFALAAYARDRLGWTTLAVSVATLTRPEGTLIAAVLFAFYLASSWRQGWRAWRWPLVYAGLLALLTAFRLAYYGSPLPNTFYAKVGGIPIALGIRYVHEFLRDGAFWLLLPSAIAVVGDRRLRPGAAYVLLAAVYAVTVGGDVFPHARFLLPAVACLAVLAVRGTTVAYRINPYLGIVISLALPGAICGYVFGGISAAILVSASALGLAWALTIWLERRWIVPACALMLAAGWGGVLLRDFPTRLESAQQQLQASKRAEGLRRAVNHFSEREAQRRVRIFLQEQPRARLIAASGIGRIGYYSQIPILDIFGIIDPTIARSEAEHSEGTLLLPGHQRSNADYVFAREPDYILLPKAWTSMKLPALVAIWEHPDLEALYEWEPQISGYRRKPKRTPEGLRP